MVDPAGPAARGPHDLHRRGTRTGLHRPDVGHRRTLRTTASAQIPTPPAPNPQVSASPTTTSRIVARVRAAGENRDQRSEQIGLQEPHSRLLPTSFAGRARWRRGGSARRKEFSARPPWFPRAWPELEPGEALRPGPPPRHRPPSTPGGIVPNRPTTRPQSPRLSHAGLRAPKKTAALSVPAGCGCSAFGHGQVTPRTMLRGRRRRWGSAA